jgi:FdhE protein
VTTQAAVAGRWTTRIRRAEALAVVRPEAEALLRFFVVLAEWQHQVAEALDAVLPRPTEPAGGPLPPDHYPVLRLTDVDPALLSGHADGFRSVLRQGPPATADLGRILHDGPARYDRLVQEYLFGDLTRFAEDLGLPLPLATFAGQVVCQPLLELLSGRAAALVDPGSWYEAPCPCCGGPPVCSYLRGLGEPTGQRLLVCARCLFEWPFPRLRCPNCAEEQDGGFSPVLADQYRAVRVDVCTRCRSYLKTADARQDGRVVAIVDDIASIALDLWAESQGLHRLAPALVR